MSRIPSPPSAILRLTGLLAVAAFVLGTCLSGCSLFPFQEASPAFQAPGQADTGSAEIAFSIVLPDAVKKAGPLPAIRPSTGDCRATFRLLILQPDAAATPFQTLSRTVTVGPDGTAACSFSGIPSRTIIGEIEITGGHLGGRTLFHGAIDAWPGHSVLEVSPKGCGHVSDLLARAVYQLAAHPDLRPRALPDLVRTMRSAGTDLWQDPGPDAPLRLLERVWKNPSAFAPTDLVFVEAASAGTTLQGSGAATWTRTLSPSASPVGPETFPTLDFALEKVIRPGTAQLPALTLWRKTDGSTFALAGIEASSGAILALLTGPGTILASGDPVLVLPDGDVLVGGSRGGFPVIARWSGAGTADLSEVNAAQIRWTREFSELPGVPRLPQPRFLGFEYDPSGNGRLLGYVPDPVTGNLKLYRLDPTGGPPTLIGGITDSPSFVAFGFPSSGTLSIDWEAVSGATAYDLYWAKGSAVATETSTVRRNASHPTMIEGVENGATYTILVTAVAADGRPLAISNPLRLTPKPAAPPQVVTNFDLASTTIEIGGETGRTLSLVATGADADVFRVTGPNPITAGSVLVDPATGYLRKVVSVSTAPGGPDTTLVTVETATATLCEVFRHAKFSYSGPLSQMPVLSERALNPLDPNYSKKLSFLRRPRAPWAAIRRSIRAAEIPTPEGNDDPGLAVDLRLKEFRCDPHVVFEFETNWGLLEQFELRVDGQLAFDIAFLLKATKQGTLPIVAIDLLPHEEIPFLIGPVPGTWGRDMKAFFRYTLTGQIQTTVGTTFQADFRCGANFLSGKGWEGQLLRHVEAVPYFELDFQGSYACEAAIEFKNSLKVGGLAGPELMLKPYLSSTCEMSFQKACDFICKLSIGLQGAFSAIIEAWDFKIAKWEREFDALGPYVLRQQTICLNTPPTAQLVAGPAIVPNLWDGTVIYTEFGADTFDFAVQDTGWRAGITKVDCSLDGRDLGGVYPTVMETASGTARYAVGSMTNQTPLPAGVHHFSGYAVDRYGATSTTVVRNFTVQDCPNPLRTYHDAEKTRLHEEFSYAGLRRRTPTQVWETVQDWWPVNVPRKHGLYKQFTYDGKPSWTGSYTDDRKSGDWTDNGEVTRKTVSYNDLGSPTHLIHVVNGVTVFEVTPQAGGIIVLEDVSLTPKDGKIHGVANGGSYDYTLVNGKREGTSTSTTNENDFFTSTTGTFRNDLKTGTWSYYTIDSTGGRRDWTEDYGS